VPPLATLSGGSRVMNGSMLDRAASLGTRATADMEIFLLNTVWLPVYIIHTPYDNINATERVAWKLRTSW